MGLIASVAFGAQSIVLDCVVASLGRRAITASDVRAEYRLEQFLDGKMPSDAIPSVGTSDRARDRLIDQTLLIQEAAAEGIALPPGRAVAGQLAALRRKFPSASAYESALAATGLTEVQVRARLRQDAQVLQVLDHHLRPLTSIQPQEIEAYYRKTFLPELAKRNRGEPPQLGQVEGQIREILIQRRMNELLPAWIKELRTARRVTLITQGTGQE